MGMSASWRRVAYFALYIVFILLAEAVPVCFLSAEAALSPRTAFPDGDRLEFPVGQAQKEALLSIVYAASTYGELYPCPT